MTNVMYQDLTVKNTIDATSVGTNLLTAIRADAYEVGDVYISTNATSPASKYGGTWEQLDGDAYFKIVTSGAGQYGGKSGHIIATDNLPNAELEVRTSSSGSYPLAYMGLSGGVVAELTPYIGVNMDSVTMNRWGESGQLQAFLSGGGQAYYPYYYGLYAWVRTA